ncbi:hypothetical protein D3C87_1244660 [compost metagenome]
MACRDVNASGSRTSQSPCNRARCARQPQCVSPTPKPFSTTRSPVRQRGSLESSTVPAPSIPATIGHLRTTGARPVIASPSLKLMVE